TSGGPRRPVAPVTRRVWLMVRIRLIQSLEAALANLALQESPHIPAVLTLTNESKHWFESLEVAINQIGRMFRAHIDAVGCEYVLLQKFLGNQRLVCERFLARKSKPS